MNIKNWFSYVEQIKIIKKYNNLNDYILYIGNEDNLIKQYLKNKYGYSNIITFDKNPLYKPDITGNILNINKIHFNFNSIVCCEVLEHLPFYYFENIIMNLSKLTKYLILSLPYCNYTFSFYFTSSFSDIFKFNFILPFKYKKYNEHFWELNYNKETKLKNVKKILNNYFHIIKSYNFNLYPYHHYFILKSKK